MDKWMGREREFGSKYNNNNYDNNSNSTTHLHPKSRKNQTHRPVFSFRPLYKSYLYFPSTFLFPS